MLCASPPPDLCAGGAVHRGHRGVGPADVPHAGDQGAALHFPGGLSVLRWRPAVRPGGGAAQTGSSWPGLGLWASGVGPGESSSDVIHPAHWENLSTLFSLCHSTHTERMVGFQLKFRSSHSRSQALSHLTHSFLGLAPLPKHIICPNTAAVSPKAGNLAKKST